MQKDGWIINSNNLDFLNELTEDEFLDLNKNLISIGYPESSNSVEIQSFVKLFVSDYNLDKSLTKKELWKELITQGYKLGDRILNLSNPLLYGSDVEELQELLSRLGFYSEPINSTYDKNVVQSVEAFQENRGLNVDGIVGLDTATEIRKFIRPNLNTSLNEAIKTFRPKNKELDIVVFVDNSGEYRDQIVFYEKIREVCTSNLINVNFASEVSEDIDPQSIIKYVNKHHPGLFLILKMNEKNSSNYFQGKYSNSVIGEKISSALENNLSFKSEGKNTPLLKNTKSVAIIINGNFYQFNLNSVFDEIKSVYTDFFKT